MTRRRIVYPSGIVAGPYRVATIRGERGYFLVDEAGALVRVISDRTGRPIPRHFASPAAALAAADTL